MNYNKYSWHLPFKRVITMPCLHELGIIDDFDHQRNYSDYTPQKYHCVSVDDDIINSFNEHELTSKVVKETKEQNYIIM